MMIDLYTSTTPNGRKISIALEEMQIPYKPIAIEISKGEQFAPEFLEISPNNKIPAIVDHETGIGMMESGAILMYLARKSGRFFPSSEQRWPVIEWLMFQMGGLGPMLGQAHHFLKYNAGKAPYAEQRYHAEAKRLYGVLDRRLADHEFLADEYSIADMACWPWISRFEWQQMDLRGFPSLHRWYCAIAVRPAVQKGYDVPYFVNDIPMPAPLE